MAPPTPSLGNRAKELAKFFLSWKALPIYKATLAYLLGFVLIFSTKFASLNKFPQSFTSMTVALIVNFPGKSVGACFQSTFLALLGVACGSVGFVALAKLAHSQVGQGFVFFFFVYLFALVKAQGLKWFPFALVGILMSFNGIYTSLLLGSYNSQFLIEFLKTYCWGAAISLAVNVLVFPVSSEKELRQTLRLSLEHISTFNHLLAKAYTLETTPEEIGIRRHLASTIRADFGFLVQKIAETSIEINYSPFSMMDYQTFVQRTRAMQLALITVHSSLDKVRSKDLDLFREKFLPNTIKSFASLRQTLAQGLSQIDTALQCKPIQVSTKQAGYAEFMDVEAQQVGRDADDVESVEERLNTVSRRLAEEANKATADEVDTPTITNTSPPAMSPDSPYPKKGEGSALPPVQTTDCSVGSLQKQFEAFFEAQNHILTQVLVSGELHGQDDSLRIADPLPSIQDRYNYRYVSKPNSTAPTIRRRNSNDESGYVTPVDGDAKAYYEEIREKTEYERRSDELAEASHHSLARVYSFLFAMGQFVTELAALHSATVRKPPRRIHVHLFEALHRPQRKTAETELSIAEAVSLLTHKPFIPTKPNIWERLEKVEHWFRSPNSVFAAKTAAAATIFAILILHPVPRPWFISFGLNGGVLTIATALNPTLGQSFLAFIFQILGSGIGYCWGLILLEIFKNVGGYAFNPFGMVCLMAPYSMVFFYILYVKPQFFVAALLALNGAASLILTEWISVVLRKIDNFDSPVLRFAKSWSSLGTAIALVAIFQLFVLRNPARRTLRKAMGDMLYGQLSYGTLLQAYSRGAIPSDPAVRAPDQAIARVHRELLHRELKLQSQLIELRPLVAFAAAEPQFIRPFRQEAVNRILRTSQVLLDRMRESRTAIGEQVLPDDIRKHFTVHLVPYRQRNSRVTQLLFYLIASSLLSKSPLPREIPGELESKDQQGKLLHDTLVLASRYARTEEGAKMIRTGMFTRYFHYLICISSLVEPLAEIDAACKELFGELDLKLH